MNYCTLCLNAPATQRNSHIVPKFFYKEILKRKRKVSNIEFVVGSANWDTHVVQDTMKEDYLFCPTCEAYFSQLESEFARFVYRNMRNDLQSSAKVIQSSQGDFILREYSMANKTMSCLLIYSIIFRCHVSKSSTFSTWLLPELEANILREELLRFRAPSLKETLGNVTNLSCNFIPEMTLFISDTFERDTSNLIMALSLKDTSKYYLILGEFRLIFAFKPLLMESANKTSSVFFQIAIMTQQTWSIAYDNNKQALLAILTGSSTR